MIVAITMFFVILALCILSSYKARIKIDFESEELLMKLKEVIQEICKSSSVSGQVQDLKSKSDISSSFDKQTQTYKVNANVTSHAVVTTHSARKISCGKLELLTTVSSTVHEVVDVDIVFKHTGKLQSLVDTLNSFRTQAKAYISFGQIAANVSCSSVFNFRLYINLFYLCLGCV